MIADSAPCSEPANLSLKCLHFLITKDRQDYTHIAFGNDSTNFLHEINENFHLSVDIVLFSSHLPH